MKKRNSVRQRGRKKATVLQFRQRKGPRRGRMQRRPKGGGLPIPDLNVGFMGALAALLRGGRRGA